MARIARSEVFDHKGTNCIFTECTAAPGRLLGRMRSPFSTERDGRRVFIEDVLGLFRQYFAVELIAYTIDDKCIRQMLQPQPQLAKQLSPEDVARRWLIICPSLRKHDAPLHHPSEKDISRLCEDPGRIDRIRGQLSDVAWWNRLLCQRIAQKFNKSDGLNGRFWAGRFCSTLLLDELSRLTCLASIDVTNPATHTAIALSGSTVAQSVKPQSSTTRESVTLMTNTAYMNLLDWTHRTLVNMPTDPQLERTVISLLWHRDISASIWFPLVVDFRHHFSHIAGRLENMDRCVSLISRRRFFVRPQTRRLLRQQSGSQHVCGDPFLAGWNTQ